MDTRSGNIVTLPSTCRPAYSTQFMDQAIHVLLLTYVDMFQEGPIHGRADGVRGVLGKQHMAAIVAFVESRQNVGRVVRSVAVCLDGTELCALRRVWHGQSGLDGRGVDLWPWRILGGGDGSGRAQEGSAQRGLHDAAW